MYPRLASLSASLLSCAALAGCAGTPTFQTEGSPSPLGQIQGRAFGGQQPVAGMHVYVYQAATSAYGAPSLSLLAQGADTFADGSGKYYVTTDTSGSFALTGKYTCTAGGQVYLYGVGGNPGAGINSAAGMMAVLGQCPSSGSMAAVTPYVWMNEVTTVAAAYALSGFATDATHIADDEGVSGNTTAMQAQAGLANAFAMAGTLVDIATGTARTSAPLTAAAVPQAEINSLANILAACVNSSGPGSTVCASLLGNSTSDGSSSGTLPTDTATAIINLAHNPGSNVASLYALTPPITAFSPALTAPPRDWTLALSYTGFNYPLNVAVDAAGSTWVVNSIVIR